MNQLYNLDQGIQNQQDKKTNDNINKNITQNICIKQKNNQNQQKSKQDNNDQVNLLKEQLNIPNQILPAHKYIKEHKEKLSFKLDSLYLGNKFHKSIKESINSKLEIYGKKQNNQKTLQNSNFSNQMGQFSQYFNQNKCLIYQRITNQKLNILTKSQKNKNKFKSNQNQKYFCSLFINPKINKNQSKNKPIFEHLQKIYEIESPILTSDILQFSSHFQGANLFAVFKDNTQTFPTYELFLQNDTNTKGSTQWFNFKIFNKLRTKAKFKIINFYKQKSLYEQGMKILVSIEGQQWKRVGTAIKYGNSSNLSVKCQFYCLEFIYEFDSPNKTTQFAYGYPYNYTIKLISYLDQIFRINYSRKIITKSVLCKTNMGNQVFLITISNNILMKKTQKPIIYVIGRQHSGQTPSSFVIQGFINFLLFNRYEAQNLRQNFQFRIVPMINIDGVISGNYRSNISGNDVNRQWLFPSKNLHPEVYHLKQQIISNKKNTIFFLDIHAHSRKMNSFFYGCKQPNGENKFYPFVCSKLNKYISYNASSFGDDASKQTTGRVIIQKQLNLINSLTFQISFFGWIDPVKKIKHHFNTKDLQQIGMSLALGMYYTQISIKKIKLNNEMNLLKNQKQININKNSIKIYQKWKIQIQKQNKNDDVLSEGSSIDPQQFQLKKEEQQNIENLNQNISKSFDQINKKQINKNKQVNNSNDQKILFQDQIYPKNMKSTGRYFKSHKKSNKNYHLNSINENQQQNLKFQSNLFNYSGTNTAQLFLMTSRQLMVKKIQYELQQNSQRPSPNNQRYKSIDQKSMRKKQTQTIDFKQTIRYHDKLNQMKKTFNYYINSNKDFENFKSFFTNSLNKSTPVKTSQLSQYKLDTNNQQNQNINLMKSIFPKRHTRTISNQLYSTLRGSQVPSLKKFSDIKLQKI